MARVMIRGDLHIVMVLIKVLLDIDILYFEMFLCKSVIHRF